MDKFTWLTYAFCLVWLGLGAYIALLMVKQRKIEKRVQQIELLKKIRPYRKKDDKKC